MSALLEKNVWQTPVYLRPVRFVVSFFDFVVTTPAWLRQFHQQHPETLLNRSKALGVAIISSIF